ncbi:MAG: hypothetical protein D3915_00430 [Candidatus Electrothrix sp. AU1_5]|nr:hypothetical protein [Candidatus Electrothrix gigas]
MGGCGGVGGGVGVVPLDPLTDPLTEPLTDPLTEPLTDPLTEPFPFDPALSTFSVTSFMLPLSFTVAGSSVLIF